MNQKSPMNSSFDSMDMVTPLRLRAPSLKPPLRPGGGDSGPLRSWNRSSFRVLEKNGFHPDHSITDERGELVYMVRDAPLR
jgi:hypothetical protein